MKTRPLHFARLLAWTVLFVLCSTLQARAVQVSPVIVDLQPSGGRSQSQLSVMNDGADEVAVELTAIARKPGPNGDMVESPADDDFLIFPLQARIPAGKSQVFRLQWLGDDVTESQSFAISVRQVPVQLSADFTGVQFLFNFNVLVWVSPQDAAPQFTIVQARAGEAPDGTPAVFATVRNAGNGYGRFGINGVVVRSGGSQTLEVSADRMREVASDLILLPGQTREILIPLEVPVGGGQIQVEVP